MLRLHKCFVHLVTLHMKTRQMRFAGCSLTNNNPQEASSNPKPEPNLEEFSLTLANPIITPILKQLFRIKKINVQPKNPICQSETADRQLKPYFNKLATL